MSARRPARADWPVPALLVLLTLVPSVAGIARMTQLAGGAPVTAANARFVAAPLPVILHIIAAIPFGILGALQYATGFRRRHPGFHRASSRILVLLAVVVAATGLWMTLTYPWPEHDGLAVYLMRLVVGSAMLAAIARGIVSIRHRDFGGHAAWMTRAYALAMGAGTQVLTHAPWFVLVGPLTETSRAVLMGAGWGINVVVAERWIARQRPGGVGGVRLPHHPVPSHRVA